MTTEKAIKGDDLLKFRSLVADAKQLFVLDPVRDKNNFCFAVVDDIGSLRCGIGRINRNGYALHALNRKISNRPARTVFGKDRYLITRSYPGLEQSPRSHKHSSVEIAVA